MAPATGPTETNKVSNQKKSETIPENTLSPITTIVDNDTKVEVEVSLNDTNARYAGYVRSLSRLSRYLAFTSDVGEAFRPIVNARIVSISYLISFGYCFADVGYEAYKLHKRNYKTEAHEPMTMTQCVIERSAFQLVASIVVPAIIIHTTVDVTKQVLKKVGKFQKWGPTVVGLCVVPLLPLYLDHPIEHAIEWVFHNYGPWAKPSKSHKD